jgi:hypothetical protein
MYVCMYLCVYVCMYMRAAFDAAGQVLLTYVHVCMYVYMYVCICVCMYVHESGIIGAAFGAAGQVSF